MAEIRVAARPHEDVSASEVSGAVEMATERLDPPPSAPATVEALDPLATEDPSSRDVLITLPTDLLIGEPSYASTAWSLTHLLQDADVFERVEADVPVRAFDPELIEGIGSFGTDDCSSDPHSNDPLWAFKLMDCPRALAALPEASAHGRGIRIGHPDSGYAIHPSLGVGAASVVDTGSDYDIIDDDDDAVDPLRPPKARFLNLLPNPGHGTSTASAILGQDFEGFHGIATRAQLVPFRATESVVQVFDSDVARAVRRAQAAGCHIISMSLGGTGFFNLRDAIREAVESGMIVMAAAGNRVKIVTAPASYDYCIAVAATDASDKGWSGSSRGAAVDVAAPGSCVWGAHFDFADTPPGAFVQRSHGTSYAVAHLAGVAALWLAKWGYDTLIATFGATKIQAAFLHLLRSPGVCHVPSDWNDAFGVGRVNAGALVTHPLPNPDEVAGVGAFAAGGGDDPVSRIAAVACVDELLVEQWADANLPEGGLERYEGELVFLLMEDPAFHATLTAQGVGAFAAPPPISASPQLSSDWGEAR